MQQKEEDPGKVQLKAILKGSAAQAVRPAAMSGFKVADFQLNPAARDTAEERLKRDVASLTSQIATLNGEMANQKKKAEQDEKAAHDKGVQEGKALGMAEGEKKANEKWDENLKALQESTVKELESLAEQQKENFEKINAKTTDIALAIAKRIFCEEAAQNPSIIIRVMKEAFVFLGQEEKLRVRLNPLDMKSVKEAETFWKPAIGSLRNVELAIDETIERGGCLLESENGSSVDMRLQTIFEHVEEAVKKIYSDQ
ncbi:MAG: hypothetical protein LBQ76_00835 [Candidatus Fibromonas sp.]|jgi:flagellar assembly protein FliH|nr:hypothetical protein [Candidatus Fibromonas sp.]